MTVEPLATLGLTQVGLAQLPDLSGYERQRELNDALKPEVWAGVCSQSLMPRKQNDGSQTWVWSSHRVLKKTKFILTLKN